MRFRRRITIFIAISLLALIILIVCLLPSAPPNPVYNGKTLSAWVEQYQQNWLVKVRFNGWTNVTNASNAMNEAAEVLYQNRSNAIPVLLGKIATRDSSFSQLADDLFFSKWAVRIGLSKRWQERDPRTQRDIGIYGFRVLGTNAASAVPDLTRIMNTDPDPECRLAAGNAIRYIDSPNNLH